MFLWCQCGLISLFLVSMLTTVRQTAKKYHVNILAILCFITCSSPLALYCNKAESSKAENISQQIVPKSTLPGMAT